MGESDNDSWSVVDDNDSVEDRKPAPEISDTGETQLGAHESTADDLRAAGTAASSGSRGNDSPARSVRLEAIGPSSSASDLRLPSVTLPAYDQPESSTQQANEDDEAEPSHSPSHPSSAAETSADSFLLAQTSHTPFDLGLPSDSPFASDDYEGDAMSESSTDTHIVVPRPGNEEDSAERRWRLAEQRGIDIRRASSVLSPRFQGTTSYLKVIVVGEAGLGKTTFIQNLLAALQPDGPPPAVDALHAAGADMAQLFKDNPEALSTEVIIQNGNVRCHYLLQDTPGLNYCQPTTSILDHITAKNNAYLALEQDPQRHVPMSAVEDMRVDACLFFINPNSLKPEELTAMADLAKLVPVVPMIAKADSFVPEELAAFRQHVQQRLQEEEERLDRPITWVPPAQHSSGEAEATAGPPFAVIASRGTDLSVGRFWPVRDYSWGRCETLSSVNSDIFALKQQLFEEGFAHLKQATEERYYRFRESKLSGAGSQGGHSGEQEAMSAAGAASEAGQAPAPRNGFFRGPPKSGKFWKAGLLVLTTLATLAISFNYGKAVGTRQLQQDLEAAQQLASMQDQMLWDDNYHDCQGEWQTEATSQEGGLWHVAAMMAAPCIEDCGRAKQAEQNFADGPFVMPSGQVIRVHALPRQQDKVKSQRVSHNWPMIVADPFASRLPESSDNLGQPQEHIDYIRHLPPNVTTMGHLASFGPANSTAGSTIGMRTAARRRCCRRSVKHSALAKSQALVAAGHYAAHQMQTVGQQASLMLFSQVEQSSAAFAHGLATVRAAFRRAQQATGTTVKVFSKDLSEGGRMMIHDTPQILRRLQYGASKAATKAATHAKQAVQHAGWNLQHGAQHMLHQVKKTVKHANKTAERVMHDMKGLGKLPRPKLGKTAKHCFRILAQVGVLGAAL